MKFKIRTLPVNVRYLQLFVDCGQYGATISEQVISLLRAQGANQMATVYALRTEFDLPLAEADSLVLHSPDWADQLEATSALRDDFFDAIEMDAASNSKKEDL